ncbi:UNVERIFIED_CONTAM: hypothetical protein PYX00_003002 [Menopon gallinae]|uniref:Uncharacterized protein n=1 Tax=Menopon gallinae TaxID=328185 RepID=A0AAW2HYP5_9NEOP
MFPELLRRILKGNLEVERFIGSNLISSWARVNNSRANGKARKPEGKPGKAAVQRTGVNNGSPAEQFNRHPVRPGYPNVAAPCDCTGGYGLSPRTQNWTGMPLISGKKKSPQFHRNVTVEEESSLRTPLSRLAIHTQGAPLILAGRCNASRKNQNRGAPPKTNRGEFGVRRSNKYKENPHVLNGTSDCLSVASDESSGSSHSENCLPRIIKPRKRRKKDRKPVAGADAPAKEDAKTAEPSVEGAKPNQETKISSGSQEVSEDELYCPKLHHSFEDVAESEPQYVYSASSCQCHYCDPAGIWGANFFPKKEAPSFATPPPDSTAKSFHYSAHSDLVLRRSWSEPIQSQSAWKPADGPGPQRSNSFSLAESWKSKTLEDAHRWKPSGKGAGTKSSGYGSQCLEVSTEIVTSPNGHRDIEIRFYSTSPSV